MIRPSGRRAERSRITLGMGMTEKQGGTDVRTNTTQAVADGTAYRIAGHKWFMSAPMSDAFLVLAQAKGGLTCFFMPRFRPDDSVNGLHFQRLKDKLGNRSNASSEVEFRDAYALRVGEEGRGIRTILKMVQLTRLDCAISSAGIMRAALARALHNARHRVVFQKKLVDQPMMRAVLADLALEVEGATAAVMRLCRSFDLAATDPKEARRARILTPAIKYWICKIAPGFVYEAMECLGGNGYVEDYVLARLYREAPVNAIWEGSGNVMALDLLRAMSNADDANALVGELLDEVSGLSRQGRTEGGNGEPAVRSGIGNASARSSQRQSPCWPRRRRCNETAPQIAEMFLQARLQRRAYAALRGRSSARGFVAIAGTRIPGLTGSGPFLRQPQEIECALQDEDRRMLIDDGGAPGAAGIDGNQFALHGGGRKSFIP